jgi:hypothetical protein
MGGITQRTLSYTSEKSMAEVAPAPHLIRNGQMTNLKKRGDNHGWFQPPRADALHNVNQQILTLAAVKCTYVQPRQPQSA